MLPFSSTIAAQIRLLLRSLTDSNFDSTLRELFEFAQYGSEGSTLLLQVCFEEVLLQGGEVQPAKRDLVAAVLRILLTRPDFDTSISQALCNASVDEGFLGEICNLLGLSIAEKISLGLALTDSVNLDLRTRGQNFCIAQIEKLCRSSSPALQMEQIQDVFMFLSTTDGLSKHMDSFTNYLSLLQLKENSFFFPLPFLSDSMDSVDSLRNLDLLSGGSDNDFDAVLAEIEKEMSMADIVAELGYGCTANTSHCIDLMSQFQPLDEVTIAKLIGTVSRSHNGLEDAQSNHSMFCSAVGSSFTSDTPLANSWNVNVLVDSIKQLAPKTSWTRVMENLDHEGFNIPDEAAFSLLISIYRRASQEPFPLHAVCGSIWKNADGQLSFLRYAVLAPPEVFSFNHCSKHLPYAEYLKHGNDAWLCLDLVEVLCQLAERGHATSVRDILDYPLIHCPEVLLVAVAHINTIYNLVQYEISSSIFAKVLEDTSRTAIVTQLWQINPELVLRGFVNAHAVGDNLMRILDICQDSKILPSVLASTPLAFRIKLAAIASRKELINLEKWLNDNLAAYKDVFFEECLMFLKDLGIDVSHDATDSSLRQSQSAIKNLLRETSSTFFKVLQAHTGQLVSCQPLDEMKKLFFSSNSKTENAGTDGIASEGITDEVDKLANSYFHQMFSGQLTIDAMVQLLARFKESPEKRELSIYECIIKNLFDEYKFFPKYPDRQLKLVAMLFGSLIKHQLVTHLTLGIALRWVLDALRKSVDSKMFMFGTKALEQFMDRLVEWPQYCNHILQIAHLRSTHPELVSFIERALARISSSQSESNGNTSLSVDQQQVSVTSSVESIEAPETSWQLMGSTSSQVGLQFPSSQMQQKHQGLLGERIKIPTVPMNYTKPLLSNSSQSLFLTGSSESLASQKPLQAPSSHQSASGVTTVSSSPGFPRSRSITPAGMLRQPSYSTGFGAALNIETLVAAAERRDTPIEVPSTEIQDKILFMINNISTTNMDAKAKEFGEILSEQYYPWFAQYMVMKRASIEPNFHDLYLKFLDKVNSKSLNREIVKATYENCKVLLRSDLIKSSSEERSLLKNLGSWLGKFTIGRNQALRAKEIDPKALIIEAYEKGLMIAVIPFTSKILEPCQSSLAYQPPNPWTIGILSLLAEIYNMPYLKMNLKFDIEVLFKTLGVDMKEVKPTSLLKERVREMEGNPDFSTKDISVAQPPVIVDVNSGLLPSLNSVDLQAEVNNTSHPANHPNVLAQYTAPLNMTSNALLEDDKVGSLSIPERVPSGQGLSQVTPAASPSPSPSPSPAPSPSPFSVSQLLTIIPNAESYISINPKLISMHPQMQFHRILRVAMDRAIKEIVSPVIQRSVTIASRTTKELVLKDYAQETDDTVISRSAHLMVGTLAGSLAHVTCKEPLRVSLSGHLRNLLQALNLTTERAEQIVQILTSDNLDLGCAVIENVASEKAVELIDGEIGPAFTSMRKQREAAGSAFYDAASYGQNPFSRIPETLQPKPGRQSIIQQRVYDDFIKNIWQNQSNQNSSVPSAGPPVLGSNSVNSSLPRIYNLNSVPVGSSMYSASQVAPFSSISQSFDLISEESEHGSGQPISVSHSNSLPAESIMLQNTEMTAVAPFSSGRTASDLNILEAPLEIAAAISPSPAALERPASASSETLLSTGDALQKYQQVALKLEGLIAKEARDAEIQAVVAEVPDIILKCVARDEAALAVAQKVFKSLYENPSKGLHVASHLALLSVIRDACKLVVKELTSWVIYSDEERKFNKEITVGFIRSELLNLAEYNVHLAKLIDGGRNKAATDFAISLVKTLVIQEPGVSLLEFYSLMDALTKLAMMPGSPESLQQLIEVARSNVNSSPGFSGNKEDKASQVREKKVLLVRALSNKEDYSTSETTLVDSSSFRDQVAVYFAEWCRIIDLPSTNDSTVSHYISQLQQNGLLKGDDLTDRFFRTLTELCVSQCLVIGEQGITPGSLPLQLTQQMHQLSFSSIDAYTKLVLLVLKYSSVDQGASKTFLFPKILSATVRVIQKDAEEKKLAFNPRPYFRLFINWLFDLTSADVADSANFQVLTSLANAFHALQPLKVPGWSFAWLELVSHRSFMPKLLTSNSSKGWPFFQRLLVDLFKFMEPYLRNLELGEPVQFLYRGTLRVLLVLLHDFPEFLCDYHFSLCDVIPPSCIQMRNVILSAFPRNMRLPDPSTPNLKIDLLNEITQPPRILSDVEAAIKGKQMKADIDEHLKTRPENSSFLSELKQRLLLPQSEANLAGTRYNVPLINSLVLYVGMQAIQLLQNKSATQHAPSKVTQNPPMDIFLVSAAMDIFQSLIKNLDSEGRYLFLNAVANQLRYPNNHTHYFSFVLLYLFSEANQEIIQEQITRVLLERLIVNRPHPWGLLITFIELIKNPRYSFWSKSFTQCAPEIEKLFESVSRSCGGGPKALDDGMVTGGITDGNL